MTSNHDFSSESDHLSIHIFNIFVLETWYWKLWWFSMAFFNSRFFFVTLKIMDDPLMEGLVWTCIASFDGSASLGQSFLAHFWGLARASRSMSFSFRSKIPVRCHRATGQIMTHPQFLVQQKSMVLEISQSHPKLSSFCHFSKYCTNSMKLSSRKFSSPVTLLVPCLYRFPVLNKKRRWNFGHQRALWGSTWRWGKKFERFLVLKNHKMQDELVAKTC